LTPTPPDEIIKALTFVTDGHYCLISHKEIESQQYSCRFWELRLMMQETILSRSMRHIYAGGLLGLD
jgi:hypothetical protein